MRPTGRDAGVCLAAATLLGGCAAPFADLQSARTVPRGAHEITPSYSSVAASGDGGEGLLDREYTVQLAVGTGDHRDWRFRYTRVDFGEGAGLHVFGAGPKFSAASDKIAVAIPFGFAFGEDVNVTDTIQMHPTVFFTVPAGRSFELNASGKILVPFRSISNLGVAANLGAAIGPDVRRWAIRPEVGIMTAAGANGYVRHASVGLSVNIGQ